MPEVPAWKSYVRDRLSLDGLEEGRQRDIISEVASQLEEIYLDALSHGCSDEEAQETARSHIRDWDRFARDLLEAQPSRRRWTGDRWAERRSESLRLRGGRWIAVADLIQDVRYSLRTLRTHPGFATVALLTLALGIGGATTVFTLYDQVLLRPLPYPESEELVELWEKMASFENASVSYPNFMDWRERNRVFEDLAVWNETRMSLTGSGDPREVLVARVSASTFSLLRATPLEGRVFLPEEDRLGASPTVILSFPFWQEHFGGDPQVVGRILTLDGYPAEVVGILPEGFVFPPRLSGVDLYAPVELFAEGWLENRGSHPGLLGLARLRPGVTLEQARQDLNRVAVALESEYPDTNEGNRVHVASLQERVTREAKEPIRVLLLAVTFLLLIACINVANLILARATGRQQEMAVRSSLGAGRSRILRLLLTEALVLWILGGALGVVLARGGVTVLTGLLANELPPLFRIALDFRVVGIALGVSLLTGVVFGLLPASRLAGKDLREFLKEGRRTTDGVGRSWFRRGLVVAEVSLAVALLVGGGLTLRTFSRILDADPGLDSSNLLVVQLNLPGARYPETPERTGFFRELLDRVRAHPGVRSAGTTYVVPMAPGGWQNAFHVEGTPPEEGGELTFAEVSAVSTGYFLTLGIPLLSGRDFTRRDDSEAPDVVIVDETVAERYWPGENPLGKRLKWGDFSSDNSWMEVVGVVGHVKVNGVVEDAMPQLYIPHWQDNDEGYYLVAKTHGAPSGLVEPIRRIVLELDPALPLASTQSLDSYARESNGSQRLLALLMAVFAGSALLLAAVGVYGVMAQMTVERRHEIGVRVALGAQGNQVMRMVLRQGLGTVAMGLILGLVLALVLGRVLSAQLFGISTTDPVTFLLTPLLVASVALLANLLPAWRAMKVNPVRALQTE